MRSSIWRRTASGIFSPATARGAAVEVDEVAAGGEGATAVEDVAEEDAAAEGDDTEVGAAAVEDGAETGAARL